MKISEYLNESKKRASLGLLLACKKALRIKDLWLLDRNVKAEHEDEAQALQTMYDILKNAVAEAEAEGMRIIESDEDEEDESICPNCGEEITSKWCELCQTNSRFCACQPYGSCGCS